MFSPLRIESKWAANSFFVHHSQVLELGNEQEKTGAVLLWSADVHVRVKGLTDSSGE